MHTEQIFKWHIKYCWFGIVPIVIKWSMEGEHVLLRGMADITTNLQVFTVQFRHQVIVLVLTVPDYLHADKE